jgi:AhpD family alkylhydroperoxidase
MTSTDRVRHLPLLSIAAAQGKAKALLVKANQQLGFVPNMYGAMANEPALFEAYVWGYAAFRRECGFSPVEQEVIFLAISRANSCDYCMAAHSFVADVMSIVPVDVTDAIREGRPIADPKLAALASFTAKMCPHADARPMMMSRRFSRPATQRRTSLASSSQLALSIPHVRRFCVRSPRVEGRLIGDPSPAARRLRRRLRGRCLAPYKTDYDSKEHDNIH